MTGEREIIMKEITLSAYGDIELFGRLYEVDDPRASLVLIHGFGEHSGRFTDMAECLVEAGIAVLSYDLRGAGKSPGQRMHINSWDEYHQDLLAVQRYLSNYYPTAPLFLFGHSMGGAIVLDQ
jgi:acylglycerol lipase